MADTVTVKNGRIVLEQALDAKGKESSTGKSTVHHSTGGFREIDGSDYRYSLLVIKKK